MKTVNIGIIGCSGIAIGKHLPALEKLDNANVIGFCDLNLEKASIAAKKYGDENAIITRDYKKLLDCDDIDAIHVCTPNVTHAQIVVDSLDSGKHVLCEKPMAATSADAQLMMDAHERSGKKFTIAYQNRFRKDARYLHKVCRNNDLGEIYFAKCHAIRRRAVPTWGVFMNKELQGGGPLIDIGTHSLDMALWFMDNYDVNYVVGNAYHKLSKIENAANAWDSWDPDKFTVEDSAFGFITMKNGATVIIETSWALNILTEEEAKTTLCGTLGGADMKEGLRINGEKFGILHTTKPLMEHKGVDFYDANEEDPGDIEARMWIDCIINDTQPVVEPKQAFMVTRILEAIYQSSDTGKPVYFD